MWTCHGSVPWGSRAVGNPLSWKHLLVVRDVYESIKASPSLPSPDGRVVGGADAIDGVIVTTPVPDGRVKLGAQVVQLSC